MVVLGNYFLAPSLKKKAIDNLVGQLDRYGDDEERNKILSFAERFQIVELKKLAMNWGSFWTQVFSK